MTKIDNANPDEITARQHLLGMDQATLREWLIAGGQQRYRADQILEWIHEKGVGAFDQMTNLSKLLRAWLTENADIERAQITKESVARDGTHKLLLTWPDDAAVETVWIPDGERNTVCLSSQVGCPVGCRFCASGLDGLQRNLSAGEIVEQAWRIRKLVAETGEPGQNRLTNIVFMGMGEPLANYDEVIQAIRILNAPWGLGIGARKITLSTIGLPKQMRQLADEGLQLNLALSLHAADEKLRRELVPWSRGPLGELLDACAYYFSKTGREITLEYVLLDEVNTEKHHAERLAAIARRLRCNVNLLRYNPVPGMPYGRPTSRTALEFQRELSSRGVNAHVRTSRGQDVDAACGQLRRRAGASGAKPDTNGARRA